MTAQELSHDIDLTEKANGLLHWAMRNKNQDPRVLEPYPLSEDVFVLIGDSGFFTHWDERWFTIINTSNNETLYMHPMILSEKHLHRNRQKISNILQQVGRKFQIA
jgi:hypothetical protein